MEESNVMRLRDVLEEASDLQWDLALYMPPRPWGLDTECAVLDPDACDDDEEEPAAARARGLAYVLGIQQVQDIVANAHQQGLRTSEALLEALNYYYERDAFVEVGRSDA